MSAARQFILEDLLCLVNSGKKNNCFKDQSDIQGNQYHLHKSELCHIGNVYVLCDYIFSYLLGTSRDLGQLYRGVQADTYVFILPSP